MVWAKYETLKPAPRSRYAHGAVSLGMSARQVLIFGGHGGECCLHYRRSPPALRCSHYVFVNSGSAFTFARYDFPIPAGRSRYYSDVHVLQLPLQQTAAGAGAEPSDASQITVGAIQPASQQHHGAGSILSSILPSSWLRNIGANRDSDSDDDDAAHRRSPSQPGSQAFWLSPQVNGVPPTKRSGHTSTLIGSKLFIIGGAFCRDVIPTLPDSNQHVKTVASNFEVSKVCGLCNAVLAWLNSSCVNSSQQLQLNFSHWYSDVCDLMFEIVKHCLP